MHINCINYCCTKVCPRASAPTSSISFQVLQYQTLQLRASNHTHCLYTDTCGDGGTPALHHAWAKHQSSGLQLTPTTNSLPSSVRYVKVSTMLLTLLTHGLNPLNPWLAWLASEASGCPSTSAGPSHQNQGQCWLACLAEWAWLAAWACLAWVVEQSLAELAR